MKLPVKAWGESQSEQVRALAQDPTFRKASPLSLLAVSAVENLKKASIPFASLKEPHTATVFCSNYGELSFTTEFFRHWSLSQVGRPFYFQNSLHSSTLGFLSLHYGWKGPSFTCSLESRSAWAGLELALTLLRGNIDQCLVIAADEKAEYFSKAFDAQYGPKKVYVPGAQALLLARENCFEINVLSATVSESSESEYNDARLFKAIGKAFTQKEAQVKFNHEFS